METKFTKGEWHARIGFNNQWTIFNENALGVADVAKWPVKSEEEAEANAKLIAAAPDLLEQLESAFNEITNLNSKLYQHNIEIDWDAQRKRIELMINAIKKATE